MRNFSRRPSQLRQGRLPARSSLLTQFCDTVASIGRQKVPLLISGRRLGTPSVQMFILIASGIPIIGRVLRRAFQRSSVWACATTASWSGEVPCFCSPGRCAGDRHAQCPWPDITAVTFFRSRRGVSEERSAFDSACNPFSRDWRPGDVALFSIT